MIDYEEEIGHGIPTSALRELSIFKDLAEDKHPNLLNLIDVIPSLCKISM